MPAIEHAQENRQETAKPAILCLVVRNHPGVMLQICSLFARRGFNLEGIFCTKLDQGETSCIWLKVGALANLDQVVSQLQKREDVLSVEERGDTQPQFQELESALGAMHRMNRQD